MKTMMTLTALVAALSIGDVQAQQITGTGRFCVKNLADPIKCDYETIEQCQAARTPSSNAPCIPRSEAEGIMGEAAAAAAKGYGTGLPGDQRD